MAFLVACLALLALTSAPADPIPIDSTPLISSWQRRQDMRADLSQSSCVACVSYFVYYVFSCSGSYCGSFCVALSDLCVDGRYYSSTHHHQIVLERGGRGDEGRPDLSQSSCVACVSYSIYWCVSYCVYCFSCSDRRFHELFTFLMAFLALSGAPMTN